MKTKSICNMLQHGHSLGCWASGGGLRIVAIIDNKSGKTVASGEGGTLLVSFNKANIDCRKYFRKKVYFGDKTKNAELLATGKVCKESDLSILEQLDPWVRSGSGHLSVNFEKYNDTYIVMLDGYNENTDRVVQLGFHKDLLTAIKVTFDAEKKLLKK